MKVPLVDVSDAVQALWDIGTDGKHGTCKIPYSRFPNSALRAALLTPWLARCDVPAFAASLNAAIRFRPRKMWTFRWPAEDMSVPATEMCIDVIAKKYGLSAAEVESLAKFSHGSRRAYLSSAMISFPDKFGIYATDVVRQAWLDGMVLSFARKVDEILDAVRMHDSDAPMFPDFVGASRYNTIVLMESIARDSRMVQALDCHSDVAFDVPLMTGPVFDAYLETLYDGRAATLSFSTALNPIGDATVDCYMCASPTPIYATVMTCRITQCGAAHMCSVECVTDYTTK